ncbi:MAG: BON domain-containing protein [Burkholderiales bacterium]|nr:BON domain-containing protein [Burkholderiales bacterium]
MPDKNAVIKQVRKALEHDTRINLHRHPVRIGHAGDVVMLEGEVESVAAKKLALEYAAAVPGVRGVADRLRVAPAERRGDGAIRDSVCAALLGQPEFRRCALRAVAGGRTETLRDVPAAGDGDIEAAVSDGVITLEGRVGSHSHKRVAGVLAWWAPGCRDVVNSLVVEPHEADGDDEVMDALGLVFEIDPAMRGAQIHADCHDYVITLDGVVGSEGQRRRAEFDAWCLFAVDGVLNRIEVRR